jgi:iron complex transport system permease protein
MTATAVTRASLPRRPVVGRATLVLGGLVVLLVAGVLVSAGVGQLGVGARGVTGALLDRVGVSTSWRPDAMVADAIWFIRVPRIAMCVVVGTALAVAGAVMQAVFGNPLAEPGVVGVSAGAALGAAIAIAAGLTAMGGGGIALLAFLGGLGATLFVYATARSRGRTEVVTLLLTGIAVNAFAGAGLALVLFSTDTASREQIVFWQLGSINGTRWVEVVIAASVTLPGVVVALLAARRYDVLALGERTAAHLGIRVERLRILSIVMVALLTGAAVAFTGIVAFVGLVAPHVMRMLLGPGHRLLLVGSAAGGAALIVWADVLARTIVAGADLPLGLFTSVIGGPFFLHLVRRARSRAGGWA